MNVLYASATFFSERCPFTSTNWHLLALRFHRRQMGVAALDRRYSCRVIVLLPLSLSVYYILYVLSTSTLYTFHGLLLIACGCSASFIEALPSLMPSPPFLFSPIFPFLCHYSSSNFASPVFCPSPICPTLVYSVLYVPLALSLPNTARPPVRPVKVQVQEPCPGQSVWSCLVWPTKCCILQ